MRKSKNLLSKKLLILFYLLIISLVAIQTYPLKAFASKENNKASNLEIDFVNPSDGSAEVPPGSIISVTFFEPIKENGITKNTFYLIDETSSQKIEGKISILHGLPTILFEPVERLTIGHRYRAVLKAGVESINGSLSGGDFTWSFVVGDLFENYKF